MSTYPDFCFVSNRLLSSPLLSEVWLRLGAVGFPAGQTKAVCQRHAAYRPGLPVPHLQEVHGLVYECTILGKQSMLKVAVEVMFSNYFTKYCFNDYWSLQKQRQLLRREKCGMFNRRHKQCFATCFRHSRAYLHALFKSDTAAMHHITIHNIAYQVSAKTYVHVGSPASALHSFPSQ